MKKEQGITLVSLVVTIIVLIILAGVSINLTLGKNGIITKAKQAKENIELAKVEEETRLNELYTQIEAEGGITGEVSYDAIAKLSEFKRAIADAIEEAGGIKPEYTSDSTTFGESIKGILIQATKDATATAEDIANGKTAWVNGSKITGTAFVGLNNATIVGFTSAAGTSSTNWSTTARYTFSQNVQKGFIIVIVNNSVNGSTNANTSFSTSGKYKQVFNKTWKSGRTVQCIMYSIENFTVNNIITVTGIADIGIIVCEF